MKKDVKTYVQGCDECQFHNQTKFSGTASLRNADLPRHPLDKDEIEFRGPFPNSIPD